MACYRPVKGFQLADGRFSVVERGDVRRTLQVPCGSCVGCVLSHSRSWAIRITHEASLYPVNSFITLTYNEDNCPKDLVYKHFRLFMRRLKKHRGPTRYFVCGEYGSKTGRPHFHAILFGCHFADRVVCKSGKDLSTTLYRSPTLEMLWPYGMSTIGAVTFQSAAYVAGYVVKKAKGGVKSRVDEDTGEIVKRREFCHMSLNPGIGADWFKRYRNDVYNGHDYVVVNGVRCRPPRYYDKLERDSGRFDMDAIEFDRAVRAELCSEDSTPERLAVREAVALARISVTSKEL